MREWTPAQFEGMEIVYAHGWTGPCGHPGPVFTVDEQGTARCTECGSTAELADLKASAR